MHFNPSLPITLATDASLYGVGAVISHTCSDGVERPIAFASRTLSDSEKNYAQLEKEALSFIFGIKKFHQYLYGRKFKLITDHKPLTTILGPKTGIPSLAAARLQRWALLLSAYNYDIEYRNTSLHANADALSRLPLPSEGRSMVGPDICTMFNITHMSSLPLSHIQLKSATRSDSVLAQVLRWTKEGWTGTLGEVQVSTSLKPYWRRSNELSVEADCLLLGSRVVVPSALQEAVLRELHESHQGVSRMKALARSHVW